MNDFSLTTSIRKRSTTGQAAFVPYMMAGDGGLDVLHERISFLAQLGADAIEIGIPFTDPVADGEVIQEAGSRALSQGVTLRKVLDELVKQTHNVPLVLMTYLNPVLAMGVDAFAQKCERGGVRGLIIPDLPMEEREIVAPSLTGRDIALVPLLSLTSSLHRIKKITQVAEGFIYVVTVNGTTGVRQTFGEDLAEQLSRVKEVASVPVLAGFGISTPTQVKSFHAIADGVIVGSAIVSAFHEGKTKEIQSLVEAGRV